MSTTVPAQRIAGAKSVNDVVRQVNIVLERINGQIASASGTGGAATDASLAALQQQITQLQILSGAYGQGTGTPVPSTPPGTVAVNTDGVTIGGDGTTTPIFLIVPLAYSVRSTSTSPDAVTASDVFVLASASSGADIVENLPAATGTNRILLFKKMDANAHNVAITPHGSDTIDGVNAAVDIMVQYDVVRLVDAGTGAWATW